MFDFIKRAKKPRPLTRPFIAILDGYCESLRRELERIGIGSDEATRLELALFLLFRADFVLQKSPNPAHRQLFFEACVREVVKNISLPLLDVCYLRLEIYGQIYNDVDNKTDGVFSKEFLDFSYNWLISAIKLSKNEYSLMVTERYIPLSLDAFTDLPIKMMLQELDTHYMKPFADYVSDIRKSMC